MGDWKLIEQFKDGGLALYRLSDDPDERRNLARGEAARTRMLRQFAETVETAVNAAMPIANPKYDPGHACGGLSGYDPA